MAENKSIELVEEWRDIAGYEGLYQVSNFGRVKSLPHTVIRGSRVRGTHVFPIKGRIMALGKCGRYKHRTVGLTRNCVCDTRLVHRLVLEAFVGPCPVGMECRHFPDRDPGNNRLDNLSWGTPLENRADKTVHGTNRGWKVSEAGKLKMAAARVGRKLSESHKAAIGRSCKGLKHSEESKRRMSAGRKGKPGMKGVSHPHAIVNEDIVREIRRLRGDGVPQKEIAAKFSISTASVQAIASRRNWSHVA